MSIDELILSVRIDEGSNLNELYEMLRQLQAQGGRLAIDPSELEVIANKIRYQTGRITMLRNSIDVIAKLIPEIKTEMDDFLETNLKEWWENIWSRIEGLSTFTSDVLLFVEEARAVTASSRQSFENIEEMIRTKIKSMEKTDETDILEKLKYQLVITEAIQNLIVALSTKFHEELKDVLIAIENVDIEEFRKILLSVGDHIVGTTDTAIKAVIANIRSYKATAEKSFSDLELEYFKVAEIVDKIEYLITTEFELKLKYFEKSLLTIKKNTRVQMNRKDIEEELDKFKIKLDKNLEGLLEQIIPREMNEAFVILKTIVASIVRDLGGKEMIEKEIPKLSSSEIGRAMKEEQISHVFTGKGGIVMEMLDELMTQFFTSKINVETLQGRLFEQFGGTKTEKTDVEKLFGLEKDILSGLSATETFEKWKEGVRDFDFSTLFKWDIKERSVEEIIKTELKDVNSSIDWAAQKTTDLQGFFFKTSASMEKKIVEKLDKITTILSPKELQKSNDDRDEKQKVGSI